MYKECFLKSFSKEFFFVFYYITKLQLLGGPCGVMVKALECGIVVCEFVLESRYNVHFRANTIGKRMNPLFLPAMG